MSKWKHKKFSNSFSGHYERDKRGERIFYLVEIKKKSTKRFITFESWQAAKKLGWIKYE